MDNYTNSQLKLYTASVGSLYMRLFVASRLQRVHGSPAIAIYVQWRRRVWLQLPRRRNISKPYGGDGLPCSEVLRAWSGLTEGDPGCDPSYTPTRTWQQIADDQTLSPNARSYAADQAKATAARS